MEPALLRRGLSRLTLTTQWKIECKGDVMLIKAKTLKGYSLKSLDGDIGAASEFFFDDRYWAIRYLVANTATWLSGRKVLISPYSLDGVNTAEEKVFVLLNRKQIKESPSIDMDEPVSRICDKVANCPIPVVEEELAGRPDVPIEALE